MTVPVQQVSLIEARNALNAAVNKQRGGIPTRQDEIDLAFAALDIAITKVLAELTVAEAERDRLKAEKANTSMLPAHGFGGHAVTGGDD